MTFEIRYSPQSILLRLLPERSGLFGRLLPAKGRDLEQLTSAEKDLLLALADLRTLAQSLGEPLEIAGDQITLGHRLAAGLDAKTAAVIGLPPLTDLTLRTDVEGVLGTEGFRLRVQWLRSGQRRTPTRIGALLETDRGLQRLPLWMLDAIEMADDFRASRDDAQHWEALATFRKALEPGVDMTAGTDAARLSMTDFLSGLDVSLADAFSISPSSGGDDFEVLPFSRDDLERGDEPSESGAALQGPELAQFQRRLRERGSLNAFRLAPGRFIVVDRSAAPALKVMADMQRAPLEERRAFVRNPRVRIADAIESHLRLQSDFDAMSPAAQEEAIEAAAGPLFVETKEFGQYSARVTGVDIYSGNPVAEFLSGETTWLPEVLSEEVASRLTSLPTPELQKFHDDMRVAIADGVATVPLEDLEVVANVSNREAVRGILESRHSEGLSDGDERDAVESRQGPVILATEKNFEMVGWRPSRGPRDTELRVAVPSAVRTNLKDHQVKGLEVQIDAWKAGMPGILNADEQGLGKTLQTIAFLTWLNEHMKRPGTKEKGPVLVVAPTSLLENWEKEVDSHVERPGLGHLIRLYGSATSARRLAGASGRDTEDGQSRLDFSDVYAAIDAGAGHLTWILTTYTTLTNYQHSLGRIPFAAAVFDEIQNVKNPGTLAANAARAINADFRIGLTGTPIENATGRSVGNHGPTGTGIAALAQGLSRPVWNAGRRQHA